MAFQKYKSSARLAVTHDIIVRRRIDKKRFPKALAEARSFGIVSPKSTEQIREELRALVVRNEKTTS